MFKYYFVDYIGEIMSALEQEQFVAIGENAESLLPGVEDCDPIDFLNGDEVLDTIFTHVNSSEIIYEPQRKRAKLIGINRTVLCNCSMLK